MRTSALGAGFVSIHATLAGGDVTSGACIISPSTFLSTPPSRVATMLKLCIFMLALSFYPRHPRGWRRPRSKVRLFQCWFLSTPPSRVATRADFFQRPRVVVAIHATLAGGDVVVSADLSKSNSFLSTPPSRVATTPCSIAQSSPKRFYPRHPRGWRPFLFQKIAKERSSFYPRHPRGWRLVCFVEAVRGDAFLSTPPPRVATYRVELDGDEYEVFLSTPPPRVATKAARL